jgi:ribosomal 30S subunit maturation factor RimM
LVGCKLIDRATGELLGEVAGVRESGGPVLLEVPREGADPMLVPFAKAICVEIDPAGRRIVVDLPEGLKDL